MDGGAACGNQAQVVPANRGGQMTVTLPPLAVLAIYQAGGWPGRLRSRARLRSVTVGNDTAPLPP
jgi:hypothetical protein